MSEPASDKKFYGKYRGVVVQNIDPQLKGRIMCIVPDVLSLTPSSWCEACAPLAGPTGPPMGVYLVPPIGAGVWVEFEQGDPNFPIWTGCRFSTGDVPTIAFAGLPTSPSIVLQTAGQNTIAISDLPGPTGGILIKTSGGAFISLSDIGITISTGQGATINLQANMVDLNAGALTII